ncbi:MAG: hypothetical protein ACK4NC_04845 [Candidatus Gracilibacteria bacterium]
MLIPSKHEALSNNTLVLGALVLKKIKKDTFNIEDLFQNLIKSNLISLDDYYDTLSFLWCADLIEVKKLQIILKENVIA